MTKPGHGKTRALVGGSLVSLATAWSPALFACGGGAAATAVAFPSSGAVGVSPQSSIFVVGADPAGLALRANGAVVSPSPRITNLGLGLTPSGLGTFYRMAGALQPSADYALQAQGADGTPLDLTHFSTAATYDKTPGAAPVIGSLRLWRVHYAPALVRAGGCVFSEYEGYFALDFTPATVPGTPDTEVVSVLTLSSEELGTTQTFPFQGISALPGGYVPALTGGDGATLPEGGALSASAALWKPNLEPGRTFCATITSYGRNDLAAPLLQSPPVCATVVGVETTPGTGGAPVISGAGGSGYPIGNDVATSSGGCSLASRSPRRAGGLLAVAIAGALLSRRRARRTGSQL